MAFSKFCREEFSTNPDPSCIQDILKITGGCCCICMIIDILIITGESYCICNFISDVTSYMEGDVTNYIDVTCRKLHFSESTDPFP